MLGHGLEFIFQIEQLVQHKLKVTQRWGIDGHVELSEKMRIETVHQGVLRDTMVVKPWRARSAAPGLRKNLAS